MLARGAATLAVLAMTWALTPALAQMSRQLQACDFSQDNDLNKDRQLKNCATLLASPKAPVEERASAASQIGQLRVYRYENPMDGQKANPAELDLAMTAYNEAIRLQPEMSFYYKYRAELWRIKGDLDRAIEDLTQQIRLNPKRHQAHQERGNVCRAKGDYDCAIADYSGMIKLASFFWEGYLNRGQAHFMKGDFAAAVTDLERANRNLRGHTMLWLYLARARSGADGKPGLLADLERMASEDWPFQVMDFYLDRRPLSKVLTGQGVNTIFNVDPKIRCQAQFYIGQWHLIRGEKREAEVALRDAVLPTCPRELFIKAGIRFDAVEYDAAAAELKRLR